MKVTLTLALALALALALNPFRAIQQWQLIDRVPTMNLFKVSVAVRRQPRQSHSARLDNTSEA
ncbi:hypothetical protein [Roseinatronobacter sp. S2]|uniref:hypothetical protein n=1 Tax=Roseinatronobacter sp. S2 TaxID=3035471 RepID=UPI0024109745|nr:hypothetical protein [Roseinatronobacter sp. S2]WFE75669.1 hypothetical protein P8S53_04455 [Roseinatronobacter sp. S2]